MTPPETLPSSTQPAPGGAAMLAVPAARYASGMLRRFGLLYWLSGLWFFLRHLRLEEHSAEQIRRAAERGPLVYVLHTRSRVDWLALNEALNRRRLPLARYSNGIRSTWFGPVVEIVTWTWERLRSMGQPRPPDPLQSGWLSAQVADGLPCALFLVQTPELPLQERPDDPVEALVRAQQNCARPIQLVPVVVAWTRRPEHARSEAARFLLGSQDEPGPVQKLIGVATGGEALVQAGEPVDLRAMLERVSSEPVRHQVRATRILLRRYLYREAHVIRGPRIRPYRWTRRMVLGSPEVRGLVKAESAATSKPEAKVWAEVEGVLDHIAARFSYTAALIGRSITRVLWNRIYSGVDIREDDLERIRAAFRAGTPVLVPCHRSHLDYMLISSVLFEHDVVIPHIVAGENLSFWPLGSLLRRFGAFFIKRSFEGDRVFPVVFERYLRQLVRDGFPIEFFIEGGRSRTGKLLPPKLGVLGMVLDAASGGRDDREVTLLPIGISYEQIAEGRSYARELAGESKKSEDLGQVVKASKVIRKRYGRVFLRVGEPLPVSEVFAAQSIPWDELDREHRREALLNAGERLMYRISQTLVPLPTQVVAAALLAEPKRGVRKTDLHARAIRFHQMLESRRDALAAVSQFGGWAVDEALRRFIAEKMVKRLEDEEGEILQVVDSHRVALEYYKNGIIHAFAPVSLFAAAVRGCRPREDEPAAAADFFDPGGPEVRRLFQVQVFLLRYELTLDPEVSLDDLADLAENELVAYGGLVRTDDGSLELGDRGRLTELAELTRNFLESYMLVLRAARALRSRDIPLAELPVRIKTVGEGLLAVDELRRPEALSVANLQNAVTAFREEGVLQLRAGGGGLQFDEAACQQYLADLKRLLT